MCDSLNNKTKEKDLGRGMEEKIMLIFAICAIIWIVFVVYISKQYYDTSDKVLLSVLSFVAATLLAFVVVLIPSSIMSEYLPVEQELIETVEVSALKDSSVVEGHSYLFSDYANEEQSYFYMSNGEYGKHMDSIPAQNAYIIENNDETPRIEKYEAGWKSKGWYLLGWPIGEDINKIYIPEGSVTTDYSVDMEG